MIPRNLATAVRWLRRNVARTSPGAAQKRSPIALERSSSDGHDPICPRFRSRFGGLWTDLSNADHLLEGKLALGVVSPQEAEQLRFWMENGYLIIEDAVPHEVIDQVIRDIEVAWEGHNPAIHVEHWQDHVMYISPVRPELKGKLAKLLDFHAFSEAARQAMFAPKLARFLQLIFERPVLAFQSLYFERGTQQPIHQDTAYVVVNSPMELAASWIALEDIQTNAGELEYYAGSHKMEQFLFEGRQKNIPRGMSAGDPEHLRFLAQLHETAARMGLKRLKFRPRKGDALVWHADLAHGGSQEMDTGSSRKSLVSHYCPLELEPGYFRDAAHSEKIPYGKGCAYCSVTR